MLQDLEDVGSDVYDAPSEDFSWSEDFSTFTRRREQFLEEVGPRVRGTTPADIFCKLWDQSLIAVMVAETNLYAWQTIGRASESKMGISSKSRINDWVETSVSELYRLIAVIILMGICVFGRFDEYWKTGILGMPKFRAIMTKD